MYLTNRFVHRTINLLILGVCAVVSTAQTSYVQIGLQDIIVTPDHKPEKYRRKGNPAVDLARQVIAHKDSFQVQSEDFYTADTYHRTTFSLDNFHPDFTSGIWKRVAWVEKYIDTTGAAPLLPVSIREKTGHEYYRRTPRREQRIPDRERVYGLETTLSTDILEQNMEAVLTDVDIYDDNMHLLFNRFVSPVSSKIAISYYRYYILDTLMMDGEPVTDLAFEPVNKESYSLTGHLYIVQDGTYKIKRYAFQIPKQCNINFVDYYAVEGSFARLENGLWAPDQTDITCSLYLVRHKKAVLAQQMKRYTGFDLDTPIDPQNLQPRTAKQILPRDSVSPRAERIYWEQHRPMPLSKREKSVEDLLDEFQSNHMSSNLIMFVDALGTEYVQTVSSDHFGESKWDFGPIYNFVSWNRLEGVRLRVGGVSTANMHQQLFLSGYVAFGTKDLRPKYNATVMWSFNKKRYHMYEPLRDYIALSAQYDVEEPGLHTGVIDRDNILRSIPTGPIRERNMQYVFRTRLHYYKEFHNHLAIRSQFNYTYNEAAGAMHYDRVVWQNPQTYQVLPTYNRYHQNAYHNYELMAELRYMPGSVPHLNRMGVETPFNLDRDAPVFSVRHQLGYLDDRDLRDTYGVGGQGFWYNKTEVMAEKRFWLSSFGHIDARLQAGYVWNKVPFTELFFPSTSTSILLNKNAFNLMHPMEFASDAYVSLFATYYLKGWIINRIPGLNKLQLRGVVSFSAVYGGLTNKNNPYLAENEGLYAFPNNVSALGKLPYMELTAGFENIFRCLRIDYVRRLTYIDGLGPWGRNGVKISVRLAL